MALNEVTHRWVSLVLGVALVIVTTSGALLLYRPEIEGRLHGSTYQVTPSAHPIGADEAVRIVAAAHPGDRVTGLTKDLYQAYEVSTAGSEHAYVVDPGTGRITGTAEPTPVLAS